VNPPTAGYYRHRFPSEIISHCVWPYFRFSLSFRDVEEMMNERGVAVTDESVREWCLKFGGAYAKRMRSRSPRHGDRWHLDEVFLKIHGKRQYLSRAVDQDGEVLDILVQPRRDKRAAKRFFRKLLKGLRYVPHAIITDRLGSYAVAKEEVLPTVEHRRGRWLNNRAENSHEPTRERERHMPGFQIPQTRSALPVCLWGDRIVLPSWPPSTGCSELPPDHASPLHAVA
jgi:putative transposase